MLNRFTPFILFDTTSESARQTLFFLHNKTALSATQPIKPRPCTEPCPQRIVIYSEPGGNT